MNKEGSQFYHWRRSSKKGDLVSMEMIMIILTIAFFGSVLLFISSNSPNVVVYEQTYAKEISLFIEKAEPFMHIEIPFENAINFAIENNADPTKIVKIDKENHFVQVSLTFDSQQNNRGYVYNFLSDYEISSYVDLNENILIINVDK